MTTADLAAAPDPVAASAHVAASGVVSSDRVARARSRTADVVPAALAVVFGAIALLSVLRHVTDAPGPFTPATAVIGLSAIGWGLVAGSRLGDADAARAVISVTGAILGAAATVLLLLTIVLALAFPTP